MSTLRKALPLLAALLLVQSIGFAKAPSKAGKAAFLQRVLELTNKERAKVGLPALALDDKLAQSANWKADDMATRDYFDHSDGVGRDFVDRAEKYGYDNWAYLGENIAAGQTTPEEVVQEWMASPGHRRNILKPQYKEIGIGFSASDSSDYKDYWVQEFGTR